MQIRSPFKWPGGKYRLLKTLAPALTANSARRLVEPFVGGGTVFLNLEFEGYLLSDSNADLMAVYRSLKCDAGSFIREARALYHGGNCKELYYQRREQFNASVDEEERALLFLYLNRHGYNGLVRYNAKGGYNVPFGTFRRVHFPEKELIHAAERLQRADLLHGDFRSVFNEIKSNDMVYCDPPYVPLSTTANFTNYSGEEFGSEDQQDLQMLAKDAPCDVMISNHDTPITRRLYQDASLKRFSVRRNISCKGTGRIKAPELLATFSGSGFA